MQYVNKSFTLPTTNRKMTQTDYEIAVGLRHPDGSLVQTKPLNPNQRAEQAEAFPTGRALIRAVMSDESKELTRQFVRKHRVDLRKKNASVQPVESR